MAATLGVMAATPMGNFVVQLAQFGTTGVPRVPTVPISNVYPQSLNTEPENNGFQVWNLLFQWLMFRFHVGDGNRNSMKVKHLLCNLLKMKFKQRDVTAA